MPKTQEEILNCFEDFVKTTYYTDLSESYDISSFYSDIEEYDSFLKNEALGQMEIGISHTHILIEKATGKIIGYFSLCAGALKLTSTEKESYGIGHINYNQCPCLKLGKLAVDRQFKRKGYGAFIIEIVKGIALEINENSIACRLISLDADIQYDKGNLDFYNSCGFIQNENTSSSSSTVAMHADIYVERAIETRLAQEA